MKSATADVLIIVVLATFALLLRYGQLHDSLWLDELHTAWTVRGSLSDVVARANMGNNGALYFTLPFLTTRCFGWSEWSLRLPSLVAGVATVVITFGILRRQGIDRIAAVSAAMLVAVDSHCLFFSLEARTYALVQLFGLLQVVALANWIVLPSRNSAMVFVLVSILLLYLHMTTGLLLVTQTLILVLLPVFSVKRPLYWWQSLLAILIGSLPLLFLASNVLSHRTAWSFVKIPKVIDLVWMFPILRHCGFAIGFYAVMRLLQPQSETQREGSSMASRKSLMLVSLACYCLTLLLAWNLTRFDLARLYFRRYLVAISVLPMLFTGLVLGQIKGRWRILAGIATVVLVVYFGPYATWSRRGELVLRANEDWRGAIERLVSEQPGMVLVDSRLIECDRLSEESTEAFREYCTLPLRGLYQLRMQKDCEVVPLLRTEPEREIPRILDSHAVERSVWIISRGRREWPQRLATFGIDARLIAEHGSVSLVRLVQR